MADTTVAVVPLMESSISANPTVEANGVNGQANEFNGTRIDDQVAPAVDDGSIIRRQVSCQC